jgi:hypothetical protein
MNHLYDSMRQHPDTGPVMALLDLVDPVDEFSRALVLVRDCFSSSDTLRNLSRSKLKGLLGERMKLVAAYEVAVLEAARELGAKPTTYLEAITALPAGKFTELHMAYAKQVDELMGRPLYVRP